MTVIMRDAIKPNLLQTLENTPVARPCRAVRQHRPRQLLRGGRPDRHPRRRVPRHRGGIRRRHGGGALLQHQVPDLGPRPRCRRGGDHGAGDEAALGPPPGRGRAAAAAGHAGGEPRRGAARSGQPPGPPGHRAPPRRHARRRHQRHGGRLPVRARRHPGDRGIGRRARRRVHALRERREGCGRAGRGGRRGGGGAGRVPHALRRRGHAAAEDRDDRHRDLRRRRGRLSAAGRASQLDTYERAGFGALPGLHRQDAPLHLVGPHARWAPRVAGACPSARPGPTWAPGSST